MRRRLRHHGLQEGRWKSSASVTAPRSSRAKTSNLTLGFSHPIVYEAPDGGSTFRGRQAHEHSDRLRAPTRQLVGQVAADAPRLPSAGALPRQRRPLRQGERIIRKESARRAGKKSNTSPSGRSPSRRPPHRKRSRTRAPKLSQEDPVLAEQASRGFRVQDRLRLKKARLRAGHRRRRQAETLASELCIARCNHRAAADMSAYRSTIVGKVSAEVQGEGQATPMANVANGFTYHPGEAARERSALRPACGIWPPPSRYLIAAGNTLRRRQGSAQPRKTASSVRPGSRRKRPGHRRRIRSARKRSLDRNGWKSTRRWRGPRGLAALASPDRLERSDRAARGPAHRLPSRSRKVKATV